MVETTLVGEDVSPDVLKEIIPERPVSGVLVNAMLIGLQLGLHKTLGRGASAMTQLLVRNAEEFINILKILGLVQEFRGDPAEDIINIFKKLDISDRVHVEKREGPEEYVVKIWNSVFAPAAVYLGMQGIPFTINPEAFIAAGIVSLYAKQKYNRKIKIRVNVDLPRRAAEPLAISIKII